MAGRFDRFKQFEDELIANSPVDVEENFRIVGELYLEAKKLGVFPLRDPLDGIEVDFKLAKALKRV